MVIALPYKPPALIQREGLDLLRVPFDSDSIGHLPKLACNACVKSADKVCPRHTKTKCNICGAYMSSGHVHLDYVGHAVVTDRLLNADPGWYWEPTGWTADGTPAIGRSDKGLALWIRLTVCGVTRIGVGSVPTGAFDAEKQLISDAIRNAAMRFGVALELWSKEELEGPRPMGDPLSADQLKALHASTPKGWSRDDRLGIASDIIGRDIESFKELTALEAEVVIDAFRQQGSPDIDPMDALEAEAEFDPFSVPDRPGVLYSDEASEIMQGSAGGEDQGSDQGNGLGRTDTAPDSAVTEHTAAPAEQGSAGGRAPQSSANVADGRSPTDGRHPVAASASLPTPPAEQGSAGEATAPNAAASRSEPDDGMSTAVRTPPAPAEQEQFPIRAATRLEQHQAAAARTRARFADPRPPSLSGTPVAGSGGVGEHPAPPQILGQEGERDAPAPQKGKGSEGLGNPLPSGAIDREPNDPLHHLAPDARVALIAHCKDDMDLARSLVGGYLKAKGLKNLDDERDAAHFARITFARGT